LERKRHYNIDPEKIALMGISMGGYLAARAASFEKRLTACILYNGVYDGFDSIQSAFPEDLSKAVNEKNEDYVNDYLNKLMRSDSNIRFNMMHGMWVTGAKSPYQLILGAKSYTVKDLLSNIKCPTLVLEAEKDDSFPGQPKKVYDGLSSLPPELKKHIVFTESEGAEEHCQSGAASLTNQRIFDWLDEMYSNNINSMVGNYMF
jgi:pimeloyl-ACP methyl ester carboxylesterase